MGKDWDNPNQKPHFFPTETEKHADNNLKLLDSLPRFCHTDKQNFQCLVKSWGDALLPILYPGAIVIMAGGTRMWHRLAAGMEDAGFELWDTMMWLYGSGFPKAYNVAAGIEGKIRTGSANWNEWKGLGGKKYHQKPGYVKLQAEQGYRNDYSNAASGEVDLTQEAAKAWEGYKSPQLKPSWEPFLMFRAPRCGKSYVDLALEYGSGCLNSNGGRISANGEDFSNVKGRPLMKINNCRTDEESLNGLKQQQALANLKEMGRFPANLILDEDFDQEWARYFYCAKANGKERNAGCQGEDVPSQLNSGGIGRKCSVEKRLKEHGTNTPTVKNSHPCVKPISLTRYLATLVLPPSSVEPRRLLVPFSGSGSEMIGAIQAGWDEVVGIEQDAQYCEISRQRVKYWSAKKQDDEMTLTHEHRETRQQHLCPSGLLQ